MARKTTPVPEPVRARVRVRTAFNGMHAGDEALLEIDARVQGWINAGVVEVVDGTDQARSGGAEPNAHERDPDRTAGSGSAGREPGEGFGTGGYGAFA